MSLYFEDVKVGDNCTAGPYLVTKGEIIQFDALDLELKILEKRDSKSKPDRGILRLRILLRNQRRETVLECTVTVLIARRPDANT